MDYLFVKNYLKIKKNIFQIQKGEIKIIDNKDNKQKEIIQLKNDFPEIILKNCDCSNFNFNKVFPNLNKLKFVSCKTNLDKYLLNISNLSELYLEKCNIIDENFSEIYYSFLKNINFRNNLKTLSF